MTAEDEFSIAAGNGHRPSASARSNENFNAMTHRNAKKILLLLPRRP